MILGDIEDYYSSYRLVAKVPKYISSRKSRGANFKDLCKQFQPTQSPQRRVPDGNPSQISSPNPQSQIYRPNFCTVDQSSSNSLVQQKMSVSLGHRKLISATERKIALRQPLLHEAYQS